MAQSLGQALILPEVFGSFLHEVVIDELIRLAGQSDDERWQLADLAYRSRRQAAWSQTTYEAESLQLLVAECLAGRGDDPALISNVALSQKRLIDAPVLEEEGTPP